MTTVPASKARASDRESKWTVAVVPQKDPIGAKAIILYYSLSSGKFHTTVVNFDADGKVKGWSSNTTGAY